jgi:hypothetical protein
MDSITVFLLKETELRDEKLEHILKDKSISQIKFTKMNGGVLATTNIPNLKEFGKDKTIAKIETDYFGGIGHQRANLFVNGKKVYDKSSEFDYSANPINDVLKQMGIQSNPGMDEFDTIGLGKYRTNESFK